MIRSQMVRRDELCHESNDSENSSQNGYTPAPARPQPQRATPADTGLTSTAHAQRPATNAPPSQPPAEPQPSPATAASLLPQGPAEGHRPSCAHKRVPAHHLRYPPKHSATPFRPSQIIDKPACPRGRFHPPQQRNDLLLLQMMRHQRAHDDIRRLPSVDTPERRRSPIRF